MSDAQATPILIRRLPFYYGWVNLAVAVVAMIGTLPGRTWGLGLITEPLLQELDLGASRYADINFWGTLLGAAFCLPAGWLIDRFGSRIVMTVVTLGLGTTVVAMSQIPDTTLLLPLVLLTRGFGQSALSIVSLALIGKWFFRRISLAMTVWCVIMVLGFAAAERLLGYAVREYGWRTAWCTTGWLLIAGLAPLGWLFARSTPEQYGLAVDGDSSDRAKASAVAHRSISLTLGRTLLTPAFWVLAIALSLNSLTQAGIGLFGQRLVKELHFEQSTFVDMMSISTLAFLPGNLLTGWRSEAWSLRGLVAIGMALLAISMLVLPRIETWTGIIGFASVWGFACGVISVSMNAIWGRAFGRRHLGNIQGAVAVCHVLSSSGGPKIMVWSQESTGYYGAFFYVSAGLAAVTALGVLCMSFPNLESADDEGQAAPAEPVVAVATATE